MRPRPKEDSEGIADTLGKDFAEGFGAYTAFTTVFAPSVNTLGLPDRWFHPGGPERTGYRIYLSPRLERKSQARVNSVVAHEFAHVILGHDGDSFPVGKVPKKYKDLPAEKAADALIESWGDIARTCRLKAATTVAVSLPGTFTSMQKRE